MYVNILSQEGWLCFPRKLLILFRFEKMFLVIGVVSFMEENIFYLKGVIRSLTDLLSTQGGWNQNLMPEEDSGNFVGQSFVGR